MNDKYALSPAERVLLRRHLDFYLDLATGRLPPSTAEQEHFVAVAKGRTHATTEHERAFAKWMREQARLEGERAAGEAGGASIPDYEEGYPRPGWFTDGDWRKMRGQRFGDLLRRQKE